MKTRLKIESHRQSQAETYERESKTDESKRWRYMRSWHRQLNDQQKVFFTLSFSLINSIMCGKDKVCLSVCVYAVSTAMLMKPMRWLLMLMLLYTQQESDFEERFFLLLLKQQHMYFFLKGRKQPFYKKQFYRTRTHIYACIARHTCPLSQTDKLRPHCLTWLDAANQLRHGLMTIVKLAHWSDFGD